MLVQLLIPLLALAPQATPKTAEPAKPGNPQVIAPAGPKPGPKDAPKDETKPGSKDPAPTPVEGDGTDGGSPELTKEQIEARALTTRALGLFKTNEFTKAMEVANQALELDPKYELAVRVLGWCAIATGDDRKAEPVLTRALNMNPADGELQFLLAGCHKRLEEWGAAKDLLTDLLHREGPTVRVLLEMGECCLGDGDFAGALAVLEHARQMAPKDRSIAEHIVDVHEAKEDWDSAAKELRALIGLAPKEAPLRYRLVQAFLNANKLEDAATELEETAKAFESDPQPHKLLETLYSGPLPNSGRLEYHRNWLKDWNQRRR